MRTPQLLSAAFSACLLTLNAHAAPAREVIIDNARFEQLTCDEQAHVLDIKARLETIMATDRSQLDRAQRAELRSEWKDLKAEMADMNRGGTTIYISTAGLIIIILLLIILL